MDGIKEDKCKHCGLRIIGGPRWWSHGEGSYRGKMRCGKESGLPYGYNAHPVGTYCEESCLGYED